MVSFTLWPTTNNIKTDPTQTLMANPNVNPKPYTLTQLTATQTRLNTT